MGERRLGLSVHDIWNGVLAGDTGAWKQLVDMYAPLVFTIARRARLSEADAEDCSQQVWINLYRRRHSIRDPQALPAWLIKASHRLALSFHTSSSRREAVNQTQITAPLPLPDREIAALQESAIIDAAMRQLDPRCRKLLTELYLTDQEKSYRRLAQELGVKSNSLGPLRSRCLERLRKILENLGWEPD